MVLKKIKLATALVVGGLLAFSSIQAGDTIQKTVSISWSGCGISKAGFMQELADAYEIKTGIKIDLKGGGAVKGIRNTNSGNKDLGGSCRYTLLNEPLEANVNMEPVAWDPLVVIVHPDNPLQNITLVNLKKVFEGKITDWKDLGQKPGKINLYTRIGKLNGVGYTFREVAFKNADKEYTSKAIQKKSSGPVHKAIKSDIMGIAITGGSAARKKGSGVKQVKLDGVYPSIDNMFNGSYNIYRPLYMVSNKEEQRVEVLDFIQFASSEEGREVIKKAGSLPYLDGYELIYRQLTDDVIDVSQ